VAIKSKLLLRLTIVVFVGLSGFFVGLKVNSNTCPDKPDKKDLITSKEPVKTEKPAAKESALSSVKSPSRSEQKQDTVDKGESSQTNDEVSFALLDRYHKPFKGDLKQIRKRRILRVLVSHSKSNFFIDNGRPLGFEYDMLSDYSKFLNKSAKNKYDETKMVFIPVPFDQLLTDLQKGKGDIAAAGLTITPERQQIVQFTNPYIQNVNEVVVLKRSIKDVQTIDDLSDRTVYVRPGSSYVTHLKALNKDFEKAKKKPIKIVTADNTLATEDILELVNAGIVDITVADQHIAEAWAQMLPNIVIKKDFRIHSGGGIAWAVRKNNPQLLSSLNTFTKKIKIGSLVGNVLFKRYYKDSKWIKNPVTAKEQQKLENFISLLGKYADRYGFDWLAIAAQAYQESGLDHSKKSPAGAVGIMQVLPSTAADKSVNIRKIHVLDNNIHAGVKYLNYIREKYFDDPKISPTDRVYFAWAAYNAGPNKINALRKKAAKRGFDPNQWFSHVEKIASEVIGRETVEYVANINKYYIAYKLQHGTYEKRREKLEAAGLSERTVLKTSTGKNVKKTAPKTVKKKSGVRYHTVRSGETLYSISRRYGISVDKIARLNKLRSKKVIHPGTKLRVSQ
jgi:membrane-bound lytic murein transglycosylase MltF